ncbi:MAG: metallophosphatase [Chloroflexota bacterium]|nr:metallophosphatase [Chloroflexota bacterium]
MARRASFIKGERQNNQNPLFVLDAGNSLAGTSLSLQSKGGVIVEAMNAMGYDALALGRMDLALGLETLKEIEKSANFILLSANVVENDGQDPIFTPYVVLERQGIKVGIIGLSEPDANAVARVKDQTRVLNPLETARRYVGALRDQVDVLIILSPLGLDQDKALAENVSGIDIIIGGNTRKLMREPEQVGSTLIVQQGYRGEWMGRLEATFDAQGNLVDGKEEIITLDDSYADDPAMVEMVEKWKTLYPSPTPRPTNTPAS